MATATATATTTPPRRRSEARRAIGRSAIATVALLAAAYVAGAGAPVDSRSAVDQARDLLGQGTEAADPAVQSLARSALRRDPTIPAAVEMIALASESRGDRSAAEQLYRLSDAISRRSLATRLWLIQTAVERGDVGHTLAHMDIALRTSAAAPKIVFPALARGLEDPALVQPVAAMVDRPSDWREAFLVYAADNAEPRSAAALFLAVRDRRLIAANQFDRKLIARLVEDGRFSVARRVDRAFAPGAGNGQLLADGEFDDPAALYPFGWGITSSSEIGASREVQDGRPVLAYHAGSAESGQVAAQLLMLPQGDYLLETRAVRSDHSEAPPLWVIACAGQARVIAAVPLGSSPSIAAFAIPANCAAQWLTFALRPALAPQSGRIEQVRITRR